MIGEPKRRRPGRPKAPTLEQDFFVSAREYASQASILRFPCAQYQTDIIGFARDVLGYTPCRTLRELVEIRDDEDTRGVPEHERTPCLWPVQIEILEAIQNNERVAVASGHKISKSHTAAIAALWFFSCFDDARVIFTSTTYHQVETILWQEFRKMRYRAKVHIPGDMHQLARSGFKSEDFREAYGFTAKEPEAVAGISGKNLLFIPDEASGIAEAIFDAIEGNRAGGARCLMFSNPTKTQGAFFDAFNSKSKFYKTFQVSSEETPNAVTGRKLIPGLATREYIENAKQEYGVDSAWFKIRVKGEFALNDDKKPFSVALIKEAEDRWQETAAEGRLHIGIDPAGPGNAGDETAFSVRRGLKILELYARTGLSEDDILAEVVGILRKHRGDREVGDEHEPVIAIDREGPIGWGVYGRVKTHFELSGQPGVRLIAVRASDKAARRPDLYDRVRDELVGGLEKWLRDGGAIPTDTKLEKELNAIEWSQTIQGRLKATPKDDLKKQLGRSPDRFDACALAAWEPSSTYRDENVGTPSPALTRPRGPTMNPYAGVATGGTATGGFDPYHGV